MGESLKNIKTRIRGVENTQKVTYAMQMVSTVKFSQQNKGLNGVRPYFSGMEAILTHLANSRENAGSAYFDSRPDDKRVVLCVITSDTGLCGLYNRNVLRLADEFIKNQGKDNVSLLLIGKKGISYFKTKGIKILHTYAGLNGIYSRLLSDEITAILLNVYLSRQVGSVYVASTYFVNALVQNAALWKFLSIDIKKEKGREYIVDQNFKTLLEELARRYIRAKMRFTLLESFTAEHAARSLSMRTATDNAQELLEGLVLIKNKIRQTSITHEMLEIIASSEGFRS